MIIGIARKHYTSKLQDFNDLLSIHSFGFRGEAINAICELSNSLIISTKQTSESIGTLLKFDQCGNLQSKSVIARTTGMLFFLLVL